MSSSVPDQHQAQVPVAVEEGHCHETIYKSGIIEMPDTAKTESRKRRSVLDEKSVKKGFIPKS